MMKLSRKSPCMKVRGFDVAFDAGEGLSGAVE